MSFDIELLPDGVTHFVCTNSPVIITQTLLSNCENFFVPHFSNLVDTQVETYQGLLKLSESHLNTLTSRKIEAPHKLSLDSLAHDIQESVLATRDLISLVKNKIYEHRSSRVGSSIIECFDIESFELESEILHSKLAPYRPTSFYPVASELRLTKFHSPEILNVENQIIKELIEYSDNSFKVVKGLKGLQLLIFNSLDRTVNSVAFALENILSVKEKNLSLQQYQRLREMIVGARRLGSGKRSSRLELERHVHSRDFDDLSVMELDKFDETKLSSRQYKQVRDIHKMLLRVTGDDLKELFSEAHTALEGLRYIRKSQSIISSLFSTHRKLCDYDYHESNDNLQNLDFFLTIWSFFGNKGKENDSNEGTKILDRTLKLFMIIEEKQDAVGIYISNIIDHVKGVQRKLKKLQKEFVNPDHVENTELNAVTTISRESELKAHLVHMKKRLLELNQVRIDLR
ncbi:5788_t:CDS:2 [Acaulospora colombiana]|uniref:5788_t:CDS:1 n=1 Tax=Acaulospora colombiana TaxID=27376 RepID=A0ACA9KSI2_9GLOM|nr:5788_t:CDS:2 [Acaulospora colombiana]